MSNSPQSFSTKEAAWWFSCECSGAKRYGFMVADGYFAVCQKRNKSGKYTYTVHGPRGYTVKGKEAERLLRA